MSSPVEAEEQDLQNDAATTGVTVVTPSAAMQQSEEAVLDAEEEQSAADEASSLSPAAVADASTAQTSDETLPDNIEHDSPEPPGLAEDPALQPSSADVAEDAAVSDAELGSATTDLDAQEGYYPDQDARPIWSSSVAAAETSDTPADVDDRQDSQQQEDLEDRPSSSSNDVNSNAASALQPSGASAAIQAALSNPELRPDHPLLQRAQKTLEKQLLATKYRLESEVREKSIALQVCLHAIHCNTDIPCHNNVRYQCFVVFAAFSMSGQHVCCSKHLQHCILHITDGPPHMMTPSVTPRVRMMCLCLNFTAAICTARKLCAGTNASMAVPTLHCNVALQSKCCRISSKARHNQMPLAWRCAVILILSVLPQLHAYCILPCICTGTIMPSFICSMCSVLCQLYLFC